jgi:hypothetical protein
MNWLKENWFKVILLLLIVSAAYWFIVRPAVITRNCNTIALEKVIKQDDRHNIDYSEADDVYEFWFRECKNGKVLY